ncbi:hypothetical protein KSP40_PGU018809 [Platanthera guangdongensis]|uniref:Uncharacterized protein n=1 Tax=Platanthera guangdongensis TaxID=2320717 RepID=A0ABR2M1S5_9ASPA
MEEDAEKMAALKKAYADIIFNTAKESSARILAAERRALGFQQSLFAAKEEALATILRLKAIMEDKIRGAEKTARSQEKKIEELELQLGEAEDTIVDLREELKRVREELTMMKDVSDHPLSDGNINDSNMVCNKIEKEASADNLDEPGNMLTNDDNMITLSQKIADTHRFHLQNAATADYPKDFSMWKSKVPELYRNGYTQRIHALEQNSTSKGPFGEINGLHSYSTCEPHISVAEKRGIAFKSVSLKSGKTLEPGQVPRCGGEDHVKLFNKASPKKQRTLYNQSNSLSGGIFSDKYKSWASSSMLTVHDKQNENEAPKEVPSASIPASTEIDEIIEERTTGGDASTLISSQCKLGTYIKKDMGIKNCTERLTWESVKKKQNPSVCDNELTQNFLQISEDAKDPLLSRSVSKTVGHPSSRSIQKDLVDRIEMVAASREEVENAAENPENCVAVEPGTKDTSTWTALTGTDRFLKYTFQRKRKRGCSPINSDVEFPEKKTTLKPKPVDKQTALSVPLKSSVVTDLPRNNRRVVQVARQLISLSEKRW